MRHSFFRFFAVAFLAALLPACSADNFTRARITAQGPVSVEVMHVKDGVEQPPFARYAGTAGATLTAQTTPPAFTFDKSWVVETPAPVAEREVLFRGTPLPASPACVAAPLPTAATPPVAPRGTGPVCGPETCSTGWEVASSPSRVPVPVQAAPSAPQKEPVGYLKCGAGRCTPTGDPVGFRKDPECAAERAAWRAGEGPLDPRPCGTPVYVGCDGTPGGNRPTPGGTMQTIAPGTGWPCSAPQAPKMGGPMKVIALPVGLVTCLVKGLTSAFECMVTGGGL